MKTRVSAVLVSMTLLASWNAGAVSVDKALNLMAMDTTMAERLGYAVAHDNQTLAIGAHVGPHAGTVSIFTRTHSENTAPTWQLQTRLAARGAALKAHFGTSVALDGDTLVVGAPFDDDNGLLSGAAYVFKRQHDTWTKQAKLTTSDGTDFDLFGSAIALDGDTVLISAYLDESHTSATGSAYVFTHQAGHWTEQAKLTVTGAGKNENFGWSVSLAGNRAAIGTIGDPDNSNLPNSVYLFHKTKSGWAQKQRLIAFDDTSQQQFVWAEPPRW